MVRGQTSIRNGIEDLLCPFTDMYITNGSNEGVSHKGTKAMDVRGIEKGVRCPYFAPCTLKCLKIYPTSGQIMWQSINKVRLTSGKIDYITIMTAHDDSVNSFIGQVVNQGKQMGNMGNKGNSTGVHCHIEVSLGTDTTWKKNAYGNYCFNNEIEFEEAFFMDNTNIISGKGAWKYLKDVSVGNGKNYANLSPEASSWRVYDINVSPVKKNAKGKLNPKKYAGLTYYIYKYHDGGTTAEINTSFYGRVKIYISDPNCKITIDNPLYKYGEY